MTIYYLPLGPDTSPHHAAWALVRRLAAEQLNRPADALLFSTTPTGKPFLVDYPDFHFSISHTKGAIALAVAARPCGVDIELLRPRRVSRRLLARFFTPEEQAWIAEDPDAEAARFLSLWTRKEAYTKRDGRGIAAGFATFNTLSGQIAKELITRQVAAHVLSWCAVDAAQAALLELPEKSEK
jgi:Phosphopantetheinyl transferase